MFALNASGGVEVLHGLIAVAALKLRLFCETPGYPTDVLHGLIAVAALKLPPRPPAGRRAHCSPRPDRRGRIEASHDRGARADGRGVLHGLIAVAALKPISFRGRGGRSRSSPRPDRRGRIEATSRPPLLSAAFEFSTA